MTACLSDTGWLLVVGFGGLFVLVFALAVGEALGRLGPYYPPVDDVDPDEEEER